MALETFQYIDDLVATNPTATDNVSQGDDHIRGIKTTLKNTFPNVTGAITPTQTELNYVDGVTSAIQTQLDDKLISSDIGTTIQGYDADTAKTDVTQNFTAPQRSADVVDNDGSFDLNSGTNFSCTPTGNITLTFTNIPDGQSGTILLGNNGYIISAHTNTKVMGADMLTTITTAGTYVIGYISDGTNVRVYNSLAQQ